MVPFNERAGGEVRTLAPHLGLLQAPGLWLPPLKSDLQPSGAECRWQYGGWG